MSTLDYLSQYQSWPEHIRKKVVEYVEQLIKMDKTEKPNKKKVREFGSGKGIFSYIPDAEEFNKPLDDFKDYM